MSGSPFRERRLPPEEVLRVVRRAVGLASIESNAQALTEGELAERLGALGIPAEITAQSLRAAPTPLAAPDGSIRVVREVDVDGVVGPERNEELANAIDQAMQVQGRVSVVGHKLTWLPPGYLTEPTITVHSKHGRTQIRYVETLGNRRQLSLGFGVLTVLSGIAAWVTVLLGGIAVAKTVGIPAQQGAAVVFTTATVLALLAGYAALTAVRRNFARRTHQRSVFADDAALRIVDATRDAVRPPPTRVALGTRDVPEPEEEISEDVSHQVDGRRQT